jgi:hypothetical protein
MKLPILILFLLATLGEPKISCKSAQFSPGTEQKDVSWWFMVKEANSWKVSYWDSTSDQKSGKVSYTREKTILIIL